MDDHETIEKRGNGFVKGSEYDRLIKKLMEMGGDPSSCPFDTKEYKYQGPEVTQDTVERG